MEQSAKLVDSLTNFINALQQFDQETVKFFFIILLVLIGIVLVSQIIQKKLTIKDQRFHYSSMVQEKNKEIERLADDNRRYREIYLPRIGISQETYKNISAEEV